MVILKSTTFANHADLARFINENNIKKEDIYSITHAVTNNTEDVYSIFFLADSEVKEKTHGWFS